MVLVHARGMERLRLDDLAVGEGLSLDYKTDGFIEKFFRLEVVMQAYTCTVLAPDHRYEQSDFPSEVVPAELVSQYIRAPLGMVLQRGDAPAVEIIPAHDLLVEYLEESPLVWKRTALPIVAGFGVTYDVSLYPDGHPAFAYGQP